MRSTDLVERTTALKLSTIGFIERAPSIKLTNKLMTMIHTAVRPVPAIHAPLQEKTGCLNKRQKTIAIQRTVAVTARKKRKTEVPCGSTSGAKRVREKAILAGTPSVQAKK